MIITIITGGSGSKNIQTSLLKKYPNLSLNLIINGYDDGKSTGTLRNLFPNTLGISDFRKNQLLEFKLRYGDNDIYKLLNLRFSIKNNILDYLIKIINNTFLNSKNEKLYYFLLKKVNYFFNLPESKLIKYEDFSFMNIIYCSLLHINNNNLEITCKIIKKVLNLKNNIFLNSSENLILNGITKNNIILKDEESIVNFNDKNDKIIDIFFKSVNNNYLPILNKNTENIILNSNIILFSCGTQFSSLIPTYKTLNFNETINKSNALKFLVLNSEYDNDIYNYNGDELLYKINEYLKLDKVKILYNNKCNNNLIPKNNNFNVVHISFLLDNDSKHNGNILWKYIFKEYFNNYLNINYIFDYDYTIYDKDNLDISYKNINLLISLKQKNIQLKIATNNCFTNLLNLKNIDIYSNMANLYNNLEIINPKLLLKNEEIINFKNILSKLYLLNEYEIKNRKNISISIKPILDRDNLINLLNSYIDTKKYKIIKTGNTTIEFMNKYLSKRNIIVNYFNTSNYTYISDINDIDYSKKDNIKYLNVLNINTTNLFLNTISDNILYDFCIVVGGINKRMNINYPKCLVEIDNVENILTHIIKNIINYANNIYICANNYYKNEFIDKKNKYLILNNVKIKFLFFNSIDKKQNYPNGNGETIYQLLTTINNLSDKLFIMWGDILIKNNKIIEEMYNYDYLYKSDIIIPVKYEKEPYAYLELYNNKVKCVNYKKNKSVDYGYHDQCIFLCNTSIILDKLKYIINNNNNNEINFLDIIKLLSNVNYFITDYEIKSYNNKNELNIILKE